MLYYSKINVVATIVVQSKYDFDIANKLQSEINKR